MLNGKKGMFPDNFVQVREPAKPPPPDDIIDRGAPPIRGSLLDLESGNASRGCGHLSLSPRCSHASGQEAQTCQGDFQLCC